MSTTSTRTLAGSELARRWIAVVTPAEFLGFAVPALAGAATAGASALVQVPVLVVAVAAAVAYLAGLAPSAAAMMEWPALLAIPVAAVLAVVLLGSLGTAQWWVLRPLVPWARHWIAVTAGAWVLGLAVFLGFSTPLWQEGQPGVVVAVIGLAGGALMAATTTGVTGWALARLIPSR